MAYHASMTLHDISAINWQRSTRIYKRNCRWLSDPGIWTHWASLRHSTTNYPLMAGWSQSGNDFRLIHAHVQYSVNFIHSFFHVYFRLDEFLTRTRSFVKMWRYGESQNLAANGHPVGANCWVTTIHVKIAGWMPGWKPGCVSVSI